MHRGGPQCRACRVERFYERVLYPPLNLKLMDWHRKVLRAIFGTVKPEDGSRKFRRAYISTAKQNGKSFITAGLPLYHILMEEEFQPEAYGAASAKEQAGIVFKAAKMLVEANPELRSRLKVIDSVKRIVRRDGAGMYQVLSADGDVQDGIRPSLLIRDEMHRWKNAKAETLYDVTTKGQISRNEPLDIAITTAGAEYESPLWFGEYEFAKQVLSGALKSENFYAAIWEADKKRAESEPDYWKTREARVAANPSHEDNGGFLKDAAIVVELEKALVQPDKKSKFLRYNLNVPVTQSEDPVIDMGTWQQCGGDIDLRTWPEFDVDYLIRKWNLIEKRCYVGVDASWTTDMTAIVFGFPPDQDSGAWKLLPFFWIPQEKTDDFERICRVPIKNWVERGFVQQTSGDAYDLRSVRERILWGRQMFDIQEVAYDRANFRETALEMGDNDGLTMNEVNQTFMLLSGPTKFLLSAYTHGKIWHGNHPVYNWHASCMQLQYDNKDNVQPIKPRRLKSSKRIDGIQATVTMFRSGLAYQDEGEYVYTGANAGGPANVPSAN